MEKTMLGLIGLMIIQILVIIILSVIIINNRSKKSVRGRLKNIKSEQYVIIVLYVLLFATLGYFLIANLFPDNPVNDFGNYELSASDMLITNKLRSLYLDKDYVLGGKTEINNQTARLIISEEPFNFVFNPKKVIAENTTAELQLSFIKPSTEVYFNDKLIIPDLDGYEKIKDFDNTEVWVKTGLTKKDYQYSSTAKNFIYKNFPQHSIYSFAELGDGAPIIQDYAPTITKINTQFRDNLKLAVYVEGILDIDFTKQDLNNYIGADEYTIEIKDYQGESYFEKTYKDDGEKKDTKISDKEQDFEIKLYNLPKNIYYITFTKDKYNKHADSTIKNIKINSNKVLIVGNSLPLDEFEFYTKVDFEKTIGFYYWHNGKNQTIKVSGSESKTIDLDEGWKGEKYEKEFDSGEYSFEVKTGYLWIYSDVISPKKENWFYFPQIIDKKLINSDIIIIDKTKLQINDNEVVYKEQVEVSEDSKFKIQVLDETQIYFNKVKLIL